ncbi:myb-like protein I [Calliphora vicina]|uniref:myb-like protein I n=1 Tax=Calliphora vicina TaxID=7373 RepID=UPI00325B71C7
MFTIMENRKRPRLELINTNNNNSNDTLQGVASTTTAMGTATLATIGGQSFILSNSSSSALPANILLSICDDNSDESEEYILDHSMLTQIKQEHTVATQTQNNNQNQQQQPTLVTTLPQFRIVNQAGKPLNTSSLNSPNLINSTPVNNTNSNSLISNSVHLPPGCEIYVIKEVIDNPKQVIAESNTATNTSPKLVASNQTTIKLEPMSPLPLLRHNTQNLNSNSNITLNTNSPVTTTTTSSSSNISSSTSPDDTAKRSLILEAYKKRDDKRRATHNEVERRRRDKINSWIFKLKEMLPSEVTPSSTGGNKEGLTATAINHNSATARLLVQQQQQGAATTRTPPSDSKSQILIKACEYIKSMQEEINSLRECLTENENLRLSNQRLQDEINNLRNKQQQQQKLHHNNNNILITTNTTNNHNTNNNNHNSDNSDDCELTLNSLNATYANVQLFAPSLTNQNNNNNNNHHHHHHHLAGLVGLTTNSNNSTSTTNSVNVTYAKRELIITDYVD